MAGVDSVLSSSRLIRCGPVATNRLEENFGAAILSLSALELRELEQAIAMIPVEGLRYAEQAQRMIDR